MEITQNRYNVDRVIEKIGSDKLRIMGESLIVRTSYDENENLLNVEDVKENLEIIPLIAIEGIKFS